MVDFGQVGDFWPREKRREEIRDRDFFSVVESTHFHRKSHRTKVLPEIPQASHLIADRAVWTAVKGASRGLPLEQDTKAMIRLTRLNNRPLVVNSELIEFIETAPDTVITLVTGEKIVVLENAEEIINRVIEYRRRLGIPQLFVPPVNTPLEATEETERSEESEKSEGPPEVEC